MPDNATKNRLPVDGTNQPKNQPASAYFFKSHSNEKIVRENNTALGKTDILVIDDDQTIRDLIELELSDSGFSVRLANNGEQGLASFAENPAGVVLLDIKMPGIDGYTVCERLRGTDAGQHVPILIMTGSDDEDSVERAFAAGATDFTSKPLNLGLLVHRLRFVIRAKHTADKLREQELCLLHAQRIARLGTWEFDPERGIFYCSPILSDLLGLDHSALGWREFVNSIHSDDRTRVEHLLGEMIERGTGRHFEFRWTKLDRREVIIGFEARLEKLKTGSDNTLSGTMQDITERRRAESRIRTLAYYDGVTGLPNRTLMHEHLQQAVGVAKRQNQPMAVLLIDLDHFKSINDKWGHQTGDEVLEQVGIRLKTCLRSSDIVASTTTEEASRNSSKKLVARIGGDEFVILLSKLRHVEDAAIVARRVNKAMATPFHIEQTDVHISSSIGISVCPDDSEDAQTLLKQADVAMYEAKHRGRNGFHFYTNQIQERALKRIELEGRLRKAIDHDEFVLYYQPKIFLGSGEIEGLEALIRWKDPELGLISPADFIPVAEETGLIVPLGQWVIEKACMQVRELQESLGELVSVSVNLSALQLKHPKLVAVVQSALTASGLEPKSLELELTESILIDDVEKQLLLLHELKSLGIRLSIDDFGTGYSSLSYLKRFPIDTLKIDQSFVRDLEFDTDDSAIVNAAITLAHSLRLRVIAEGVETQSQEDLLRDLGCDVVQGYFHCRPKPFGELRSWLSARNSI